MRDVLESTATPFTTEAFAPRAAIFRQGDPCDSVMCIEKGRVWLAVTASSGKEVICGLLDTGAFLGEEALSGCGGRRASATAMTATHVLVVAKAQMIQLLHTQPELLNRFLGFIEENRGVLHVNPARLHAVNKGVGGDRYPALNRNARISGSARAPRTIPVQPPA